MFFRHQDLQPAFHGSSSDFVTLSPNQHSNAACRSTVLLSAAQWCLDNYFNTWSIFYKNERRPKKEYVVPNARKLRSHINAGEPRVEIDTGFQKAGDL